MSETYTHHTNPDYLVVTTWNDRIYESHGVNFDKTYNWPFPRIAYNEDRDMFDIIPECKRFVENARKRGMTDEEKLKLRQKNMVSATPKDWHFDVIRFSYKVYAYTHAVLNDMAKRGIMYFDADFVFKDGPPVDEKWISDNVHRDHAPVSYLSSTGEIMAESGFVYFNMEHPETRNLVAEIRNCYDSGSVFNMDRWDDGYVLGWVLRDFENRNGIRNHNMTIDMDTSIVNCVMDSPLASVVEHHLGYKTYPSYSREFFENDLMAELKLSLITELRDKKLSRIIERRNRMSSPQRTDSES